jgi:hypothetical protein
MITNLPENVAMTGLEQDQSSDHSRVAPLNSNDASGASSTLTASTYSNNLYQSTSLIKNLSAIRPKKQPTSWRAALAVREAGPPAMLRSVRTNIVQSIRAFRTHDLMEAASELGQHFIYANAAHAYTKGEVLESIANAYHFTKQQAKNYDPLLDALTTMIDKAGPQPGFVVVLEGLPCTQKFDKEARETLLDVFRDAVEFWAERRVPYRVFYAFA